jgi:hypothetical protein
MPIPLIVSEVTLAAQQQPHRQLQLLHGSLPGRDGPLDWCHSHELAVNNTEDRSFAYFIRIQGRAVPLIVARAVAGEKYLKAQCDGDLPAALLSLPRSRPGGLEPR